jgi:hypothetical protein
MHRKVCREWIEGFGHDDFQGTMSINEALDMSAIKVSRTPDKRSLDSEIATPGRA